MSIVLWRIRRERTTCFTHICCDLQAHFQPQPHSPVFYIWSPCSIFINGYELNITQVETLRFTYKAAEAKFALLKKKIYLIFI